MEHTVVLAENVRYKGNIVQLSQKKSEQVLVMLVPEMFEQLKSIAAAEDRPVGYVARELMIRGLSLYEIDGRLRGDPPMTGVIATTVQLRPEKKAPVVAKIEPGMSRSERAEAQRMIEEADVAQIKKRLDPRRKRTG